MNQIKLYLPGQPAPEFVIPTPVEGEEAPRLIVNPEVAFPAKLSKEEFPIRRDEYDNGFILS